MASKRTPSPLDALPTGAISVSQLSALLRGVLDAHLPKTLLVAGELSNVSRPASGHVYFTLKDAGSEVRCAMWRSSAVSLRFDPADGLAVIATGHIDLYEPRGQVQLYVRRLEPRGVGALELAFRQMKERLEREGLFDPRRKKPLPPLPRRIAIVTSPTGAAIRDMLQTIQRRFPCVTLLVHPVRVQGEGAADEIARAIRAINRDSGALGGVDVMIVGRGGGSLEDLWAFNEESIARAIFDSRIPVVSAVGHEVDISISDLVADIRAATPTAAAELVTPVREELLDGLTNIAARLRRSIRAQTDALSARLSRVASTELFRDPSGYVRRHEQRVDELAARLRAAATHRLSADRARLHKAEVALLRHKPEAVLARRRERLAALDHRLHWAQGRLNLLSERAIATAFANLMRASPAHTAKQHSVMLNQLRARLLHAAREGLVRRDERIESLAARIRAAGHEGILARGFSITRDKRTGTILRSAAAARAGERIITRTATGEFESKVIDHRQGELFDA